MRVSMGAVTFQAVWLALAGTMPSASALFASPLVTPRSSVKMQYGATGYGQSGYGATAQQGYGGQAAMAQQNYGGYGATAQQGFGVGQASWRLASARTGGMYELRNGEEQTLGRYDMAVQKNTVSRAQCHISVGRDGSAVLTSIGKPDTGWRASYGAPWQWLGNGQRRTLTNGAEVSLDKSDPEGAVFSCQQQGGGGGFGQQGAGGFGQQGGGASAWEACQTPEGQPYWYNRETGQSSWEPPPGQQGAQQGGYGQSYQQQGGYGGGYQQQRW